MRRALIRLYPAAWRARYGDEFETLLLDLPAGWRGDLDVIKGALAMRLKYQSWRGIVLGFVVSGILAGLLASICITPQWMASGVLRITPAKASEPPDPNLPGRLNEEVLKIQTNVTSRQSLSDLMADKRLNLYAAERRTEPLESIVDTMRHNVKVIIMAPNRKSDRKDSRIFMIRFTYPDPRKAQDTVNALISRFTAEISPIGSIDLDVLDSPSMPKQPIFPNRSAFMMAGGIAGLVLALVTVFIRRRRPQGLQPA